MPDIAQCVAGALIRDGKVLLVKRSPQVQHHPGAWDLIGGHVEGDESLEDALRREAREELQVEVESLRLLGAIHDPVEPAEISVFVVFRWRGEPVNAAPAEHTEIGWFRADELPHTESAHGYDLVMQALTIAVRESTRRDAPVI